MSENNLPVVAESLLPTLIRPVAKPVDLIAAHKEGVAILNDVLQEGVDYGVIPGTGDKATLLKPGAERLMTAFGMYADSVILESEADHDRINSFKLTKWVAVNQKPPKDKQEEMKAKGLGRFRKGKSGAWEWQEAVTEEGESQGLYRYVVKTNIIHRQSGMIVASGVGSCSTMETKYIRSPRDFENTCLKMAKKRSFIDGTLNALGLSDRFTQDVEDLPQGEPASREPDGDRLTTETFLRNIYGATNGQFGDEAKKEIASLKDLVRARGGVFMALVKEGMEAGVLSSDQLRAYIEDGTIEGHAEPAPPVETEPIETTSPQQAAVDAQAPLVPTDLTSTDDPEEYNPFAETDEDKVIDAEFSEPEKVGA